MFIVLLKFGENKSKAPDFMQGHNAWVQRGVDEGKFLLVGSIKPGLGGAIICQDASLVDIEARVNDDPFVVEKIVKAEIIEIVPGKADPRLAFLLG